MTPQFARRSALALALTVLACGSQAATMKLTSYKYGSNAVNVTAPSYAGGAGGFTGTLSNSEILGLDGSIDTYCTELGEYFSFGTSYTDYTVVNASGYGFYDASKVTTLRKLFSYVVDSNLFATVAADKRDDLSTALQLAVWNTRYDTDSTLSSGTFYTNAPQTWSTSTLAVNGFSGANELLAAAALVTNLTQDVYVLKSVGSPGHQDQVFFRTSLTPLKLTNVPEPGSLALVALALGAAVVSRRRQQA